MTASDEAIHRLIAEVAELRKRLESLERATGLFADDAELDSPKAMQVAVKFDPRNWRGPTCKGFFLRDCPPEFLDMYAEALAYSATHPKPGREKWSKFDALDSRRARSWARRLRAGWTQPEAEVGQFPGDASAPAFESPTWEAPTFAAESFSDDQFDEGDLIP